MVRGVYCHLVMMRSQYLDIRIAKAHNVLFIELRSLSMAPCILRYMYVNMCVQHRVVLHYGIRNFKHPEGCKFASRSSFFSFTLKCTVLTFSYTGGTGQLIADLYNN